MTDEEQCGVTKGNGEPCENPVKYADGKCGIHTDVTDARQGGAKFTADRARMALEAAQIGKSKRGCERAAGVGKGTLDSWLEQDPTFENADGRVARFSTAFAQARAEGEDDWIEEGRSDDGNPQMAKFMLSSSYGYQESKKQETELTGEDGGPVEVTVNRERYDSDE